MGKIRVHFETSQDFSFSFLSSLRDKRKLCKFYCPKTFDINFVSCVLTESWVVHFTFKHFLFCKIGKLKWNIILRQNSSYTFPTHSNVVSWIEEIPNEKLKENEKYIKAATSVDRHPIPFMRKSQRKKNTYLP